MSDDEFLMDMPEDEYLMDMPEQVPLDEEFYKENSLDPKGISNSMHNVVRCTEVAEDGDGVPVERYAVWNHLLVDELRKEDSVRITPRKVELVVPGLVDEVEYHEIKKSAELGNYTIINPRKEFPYFPKALWIKVTSFLDIDTISRQFPQQIILVDIDNSLSYEVYEKLLFEAVAKNYVVLNAGPSREDIENPTDKSPFEQAMWKKREEIYEAKRCLTDLLRSYATMKHEWSKRVEDLWALSEKKGRDSAHTEFVARRETTIKCLDEKIALFRDKLKQYDFHNLFNEYLREIGGSRRGILEEEQKVAELEVALKRLRERLATDREERQDFQEQLQWREAGPQMPHSYRTEPGVCGIRSRKISKKRAWSLVGIWALGCSLLVTCTLFRHGGAGQDSYERPD